MLFIRLCCIVPHFFLPTASSLPAQDSSAVASAAYQQQFENDYVRVVRVRYEARQRIASHDHPKNETIYVYLRDSGPVRFTHTSAERFSIIRPAVKAGGFRLGPAAVETHEVENLSDEPTEFLRVELKTTPRSDRSFRGRYPPDSHSTAKSSEKERFENRKVRITRVTCAAQSSCGEPRRSTVPSLLVAITPAQLRGGAGGNKSEFRLSTGETKWLEPGTPFQFENLGSAPVELLRVEFKTKPANVD